MSSLEVIKNKIDTVKNYLKILRRLNKNFSTSGDTDIVIRGTIGRYLYLVSQASIDLAEAVIVFKNFRKPTAKSDSFRILYEEKLIPEKLLNELASIVESCNAIADNEEEIDCNIFYEILQKRLKEFGQLIKVTAKKLEI
jgi:uncharacterized protein YutE (UPF0331/DUF86 family)